MQRRKGESAVSLSEVGSQVKAINTYKLVDFSCFLLRFDECLLIPLILITDALLCSIQFDNTTFDLCDTVNVTRSTNICTCKQLGQQSRDLFTSYQKLYMLT